MRSVIIDAMHEGQTRRRGGDLVRMTLNTQLIDNLAADNNELLKVNEALDALAPAEPRLARVVEMRYFGGYTETATADVLELNERTARRDWDTARVLLSAMLKN